MPGGVQGATAGCRREIQSMSKAVLRIVLIVAVVGIAAAAWWWLAGRHKNTDALVLYGNVDLRQADLPFNASERVTEVLV